MKTYHVVKGTVTDPELAERWGVHVGDTEWQFSDGPAGFRSSSADFPSLEEGLRALSPCIIIMED